MHNSVERMIRNGMTVGELMDELSNFDPDSVVVFACDYGDYNHTQQALPIASIEEFGTKHLAETGYSRSGVRLIDEEMDDDEDTEGADDDDDDPSTIVVLR